MNSTTFLITIASAIIFIATVRIVFSIKAIKKLNMEPANSYEDFQEKLIKIIYKTEESNAYAIFDELIRIDEKSLKGIKVNQFQAIDLLYLIGVKVK